MKHRRQAAWRKRNPWARYVEWARRRCAEREGYVAKGIKCDLTAAQLKVLWGRDGAAQMKKPSLDRVDSDGNYTVSNCRFMEHLENSRLPHGGFAAELDENGCFT